MKNQDEEINPEGEELIRIICGYIADALEGVVEETEYLNEDQTMDIVSRRIGKTLDYLTEEGWIDGHERV